MAASASRATCTSISAGTLWMPRSIFEWFLSMCRIDSIWFENDWAMTSGGCPSAATRLARRPLPMRYTRRPPGSLHSSRPSRTRLTFERPPSRYLPSISTLKWPTLPRTAPSFMRPMWSLVMTPAMPVHVMNTSPSLAALDIGITSYPSM